MEINDSSESNLEMTINKLYKAAKNNNLQKIKQLLDSSKKQIPYLVLITAISYTTDNEIKLYLFKWFNQQIQCNKFILTKGMRGVNYSE